MNVRPVACFLVACTSLLSGCVDVGPRIFGMTPWSATVALGRPQTSAADLTGDGRSELVTQFRWAGSVLEQVDALHLSTGTGSTIEQTNFDGRVLEPGFLDIDGDGGAEILVPVLRRDSLFLTLVDGRGVKHNSFLLATGQPRDEPDGGTLPWDPRLTGHHLVDFDGDGVRDLVSVVVTGYARSPRGILVHRLSDGVLLDSLLLGATLYESHLLEPAPGRPAELFISTFATNNGGRAGGFSDDRGYLLTVALQDSLRVTWSRELDFQWGDAYGRFGDFDGDGDRELVTVAGRSESTTRLEILEPPDWRSVRRADFAGRFDALAVVDLDRDAVDEILAPEGGDEIWALDGDLRVLRRRPLMPGLGNLHVAGDLDGDGVDEIFVRRGSGVVWLDRSLRTNAFIRTQGSVIQPIAEYVHHGRGTLPGLLIRTNGGAELATLTRNPTYRALQAGLGLGLMLVPLAGWGYLRRRRRSGQTRRSLLRALAAADPSVLGLVDGRGRVLWSTARGHPVLEAMGGPLDADPDRKVLQARGSARAGPAADLVLTRIDGPGPLLWLVRDRSVEVSREAERAKTWPLVARRVAHDVKNPLTSILLTLQRLQVEYRDRAPEVAPDLDRYSDRIEARVEHVRLLTSNFLKLTSPDGPDLEPVDLHPVVARMADRLVRELPTDVELSARVSDGPAWIPGDAEQVESAVGNLVANAVDAMPDGGVLTVVLRASAHGGGAELGRVVVEVRDTGTGLTPEARDRMFHPGFSTREGGWGIGLTLVREIAETHRATLEIESERGVGTVVSMAFPAYPPPRAVGS